MINIAPDTMLATMPIELQGKFGPILAQYPDIASHFYAGRWFSVCAALRDTARRYDLCEMLTCHLAALEAAQPQESVW